MTSSDLSSFWLGRILGDRQRYRLEQLLGQGGTANVFLATDLLLGQPVAIKLLHEKLLAGEMRARFEREVTLCAALKSDHIVRVSDYGVMPEGYPFFVMEYLRGQTLRQLLRQERQLSVSRTLSIMTQVCSGLHLAHQGIRLRQAGATTEEYVKVIHRDLKPDNIFLVPTSLGELVKILDFGVAKVHGNENNQPPGCAVTNMFLGTYRYAAPEQFEVDKDLDERADIYSLGVVIYEMLSGNDPFGFGEAGLQRGGGTWAVAHITKPVLPLCQHPGCETLPPGLEAVVMQCLEKSPHRRFASVYALDQALRSATQGWLDRPAETHRNQGIAQYASAFPPPITPVKALEQSLSFQSPTVESPTLSHTPTQDVNPVFSTVVSGTVVPSQSLRRFRQVLQSCWQSCWHPVVRHPLKTSLMLAVVIVPGIYYGIRSNIQAPALSPSPPQAQPIEGSLSSISATVQSLTGHTNTVWAIATHPATNTLASGSFDKTIRLWDLQTGELVRLFTGHQDAVRSVAISADGKTLVSGSGDKTIKIWDIKTGKLRRTLTGHAGPVWTVAISPDAKAIVSGSYDGTIKIWNLDTGKLLHTLPEHYDSVWSVAISPDGNLIASGAYDGTIKIWDLQTGQLLRTLTGHSDAVRSISISNDGQILASASWDKTIKIWKLDTGELLQTLSGHTDRVLSVAISPDGQTIASASLDKTIRLWDLKTGQLLHTLTGHQDWVIAVAFGANRQTIVSGSKDKTVKIWRY